MSLRNFFKIRTSKEWDLVAFINYTCGQKTYPTLRKLTTSPILMRLTTSLVFHYCLEFYRMSSDAGEQERSNELLDLWMANSELEPELELEQKKWSRTRHGEC